MDHLPQISEYGAPIPRVPCVCDPTSFDGVEFETFPLRKGFHLIPQDEEWPKFVLNADGSRLTPEALAEIVQVWLFFGLIIEVLKVSGVYVDVKDFIECDGEENYVTTRALPKHLFEWQQRESLLSKQTRKAHFRRQQHLMMISSFFRLHQLSGQWWQDDLLHWVERPKESYVVAVPSAIEMSIIILAETLDLASRRAFGNIAPSSPENLFRPQFLIDELRVRAWCPSEIALVLEGLDDSSIFFASRLKRQRTQADHSRCSINKCLAFNITNKRYQTQHTIDCSGCQDIIIDRLELASILDRGQTPRVHLQLVPSYHPIPIKLAVVDSGPYVAISHVWSDGLGNPQSNSLPTCQLIRLQRMASALNVGFAEGSSAIWIDSLLVPVEKGREKRLALSRLCNYYQAADKVLVLDSDLLQASRACTKEELITRIFFSTWMRRLWTLEEGILSRENLEFQFSDGTVSLNELGELNQFSTSVTGIGSVLIGNMLANLPNLANYYRRPVGSHQLQRSIFDALLPALEYRSTTKAADEPLCIAHILGLDASGLVAIDDARLRMKRLMEMFAEHRVPIPERFLFTKEPKLPFDGFRWAPATFMALDHEDVSFLRSASHKHNTSFITKGLLAANLSGFTLRFGSETFKRVTYAEVDKRIYALTPLPVGKDRRGADKFWTPTALDEALSVDTSQQWTPEMQALLGTSPGTTAVLRLDSLGILLSIYDSDGHPSDANGSLLYARLIGRLDIRELKTLNKNFSVSNADSSVIAFTDPTWDFTEMEKQMQEALETVHDPSISTFLRCKAIDPCQRWCIG